MRIYILYTAVDLLFPDFIFQNSALYGHLRTVGYDDNEFTVQDHWERERQHTAAAANYVRQYSQPQEVGGFIDTSA